MKKLPPHLQFYIDAALRKGRTTVKQRLFTYLVEAPISPKEAANLKELVQNDTWKSMKRFLSEREAAELELCQHQYHARMSEIRKDLRLIDAPYSIESISNPDADEVLHFMVDHSLGSGSRIRLQLAD